MANYPTSMPVLREVDNDPGVAYDPMQTNVVFAEDVNNISTEILAIATELGVSPKGTFADVAARLTDIAGKVSTYGGNITNLTSRIAALENKGYTRRIARAERGVGQIGTGNIANNAVVVVRNAANTSDHQVTIPSTSKKLLLTITMLCWTNVSGWWNISYIRMTGGNMSFPGTLEGMCYLQSGVNTFTYEYEIGADAATTGFKTRIKNASGTTGSMEYKQCLMTVDEIG